MGNPCQACHENAVEFVAEVSGSICTACGVLAESSTEVLRDDTFSSNFTDVDAWKYSSAGTQGFAIPSRSTYNVAHKSIQSLCSSLGQSPLTSRACNIYNNTLTLGKIRPGRVSSLVAAAAVSLAIREIGLHENPNEISNRTGIKTGPLAKMISKIKALMGLHLPSNSASNFFPGLIRAVTSWVDSPGSGEPAPSIDLPKQLKTYLGSLDTTQVYNLAISLEVMVSSISLYSNRNLGAVASALLLLAYEGEAGKAMPCHRDLVVALAAHTQTGKSSIEDRYVEASKFIGDIVSQLEWAPHAGRSKLGVKGAKIPRDTNARYLKDAVKSRLSSTLPTPISNETSRSTGAVSNTDFEFDDEDLDNTWFRDEEQDSTSDAGPSTSSGAVRRSRSPIHSSGDLDLPAAKRRRLSSPSSHWDHQSRSPTPPKTSLQPDQQYDTHVYYPSQGRPDAYVRRQKKIDAMRRETLRHAASSIIHLLPEEAQTSFSSPAANSLHYNSLVSFSPHLGGPSTARSNLIRYPGSLSSASRPTRLMLLAQSRGGSSEDLIRDDELFDDGELELVLRSESEMETLQELWALQGRMEGADDLENHETPRSLNFQFPSDESVGDSGEHQDREDDGIETGQISRGIVVSGWRPMSP